MKNKSLFSQIILLVVIAFLCITLTVTIALLVGSIETPIFDFNNLNFANMIPVFIIGGFVSCFAVMLTVLFASKTLFYKIKDFFENDSKEKDK